MDTLEAWRLRIPLRRPYKLSFGPVTHYDTVMVRLQREDGAEGWGEATLLTGYTDETIEGAWRLACELLERPAAAVYDGPLDALARAHPFLVTALRTAREMALHSPWLAVQAPTRVPVLGLLQADAPEAVPAAVDALLGEGFRTLKVKVGFDPVQDAAVVAAAQRAVDGRALLRLDANQGYDVPQALAFLQRIAPDHIELFEQPCAAGDWAAHLAVRPLARQRGVPLMLDESIYSERDIDEAAACGAADYVKVKLMKFTTLERLAAAIARIRAAGMQPVLGNGVATELGCWMEACVAATCIANAGEMNGFLKPVARLFARPLRCDSGDILLAPGAPEIDHEALTACALDHVRAPAGAAGTKEMP